MNTTNVLKNQKAHKIKKIHMKSIMSEVKNKSIIEDLENQRKCNGFGIAIYKYKRKQGQQNSIQGKSLTTDTKRPSNKDYSLNKQNIIKNTQNNDQQMLGLAPVLIKKKSSQLQRKSSKIQVQLQQIVKYSQMYPSRNTSQKSIQDNINKLMNKTQQLNKNMVKNHKSKFSQQISNKQGQPDGSKNKKQKCSKFKLNVKQNSLIDQDLILNIVDNKQSFQCEDEDVSRNKRMRHLLKKSKNAVVKSKMPFDYSFSHFIESQLTQLRKKNGRNTAFANLGFSSTQSKADLREENIHNIHRFLRGECREDEQFSGYITTKQMKKFQHKYDLYKNIYKKTKECLNSDKVDLHNMSQLSVKNAVYLNQILGQCNTRDKKRQVQKVMRKLNFYN